MKVYIAGKEVPVLADTLDYEDEIESRAVCSFVVKDLENVYDFQRGMPVEVYDGEHREFRGYIETSQKKPVTHGDEYMHLIDCADMHYLADKRRVAFAETNVTTGAMARKVVDDWLSDEGVFYHDDILRTETSEEDWKAGDLSLLEVVE